MALTEAEQEELISEGWRVLQDILFRGEINLKEGRRITVSVREIKDTAQFLASKRAPKINKVAKFENYRLERTDE